MLQIIITFSLAGMAIVVGLWSWRILFVENGNTVTIHLSSRLDLSLYTQLTQSSSGVGHQDRDRSLKGAAFFLSGLEGQWDLGHTDAMNITCYVFTDYPLG